MGILLGLLAALSYGASDFAAGAGPGTHALVWGGLAGIGSAIGTLALRTSARAVAAHRSAISAQQVIALPTVVQ